MRLTIDGQDYILNEDEARKVKDLLASFKVEKSNQYYDRILNQALEDKRKRYQPQQQQPQQKLPQDFRGMIHF